MFADPFHSHPHIDQAQQRMQHDQIWQTQPRPQPVPVILRVLATREEVNWSHVGLFHSTVQLHAIKAHLLRCWHLFEDGEVQYRLVGVRIKPHTGEYLANAANPFAPPVPLHDIERVPLDQQLTLAQALQALRGIEPASGQPYLDPPGVNLWLALVRVRLQHIHIGPSQEEALLADPVEMILRRMAVEAALKPTHQP